MPPELKQFGDLGPSDFERHPVWVSVHTMDYDEPWYEEADEETFRPWTAALPVDPADGMFLAAARFTLADGSKHPGFVTPAPEEGDVGGMQPHLFTAAGERVPFWLGAFGGGGEERAALYRTLQRQRDEVFPASFTAAKGLATGATSGVLAGFYAIPDFRTVQVLT